MGGNKGDREDAIEWGEDREKFFLEILADTVKREPNGVPIFKAADWNEMSKQMFLKFATTYNVEKLKGKYFRLKSTHTKFCELINRTGVTCDSTFSVVTADEAVWHELFKRDKVFKTFKKKGCKLFPLLSAVFSSSIAFGTFHNASPFVPQNSDEEHRLEEEYLGVKVVEGEGEGASVSSGGNKRKSEGDMEALPGLRRKKTISGKDKMNNLVDQFLEYMIAKKERDFAKIYKAHSSEATSMMGLEEFSVESCMIVLNNIPNITDTSYIKALDRFTSLDWRKMFLLMNKDRRSHWLESLDN